MSAHGPVSVRTGAGDGVLHDALPTEVARPVRWGRWVSGAVVLALAVLVGSKLWNNPAIDRGVIAEYLTAAAILEGLQATVVLAVLAMAIGTVLSVAIAVMRLSANPVLRTIGWLYVWLFRGVPLLVQILFWGNLALFFPEITVRIPFTGITLIGWETNAVVTGFVASVLALSLNEAGYMAEIVRAGILSVHHGQSEAARAVGMSRAQTFRTIVLPQAMRVIVPPAGTQFVNMLKMTSLVSVIAGGDLLTQAQNISATNLRTIELLVVASAWYLSVTSIASAGQALLERRLGRGHRRS